MADLHLHFFAGDDDGTETIDRRDVEFGKAQNEEHRTVAEKRNLDQREIDLALTYCTGWNARFQDMIKEAADHLGVPYETLAKGADLMLGGDGKATKFGLRFDLKSD